MKNLCSIYDLMISVPQLYSKQNNQFTEPLGMLLDLIEKKSSEIRLTLLQYITKLEITPYLTNPISVGNQSNFNQYLKKPTLLITNSTTKESDAYKIVFTDSTHFTVTNFYNDAAGSGTVGTDFTSSDGLFKIKTTDWVGTFATDDTFVFSYNNYEDTLRNLCAYAVACQLLKGRYVSEGANSMNGLNIDYCADAKRLLKAILEGDMMLECMTADDKQIATQQPWQGYNIDELGISQTPPTE